jgi:putative hydrolase of the HAD superfamily
MSVSRSYEAVLLDMGYTLVYWEPPVPILIHRALRSAGVERSADEIGVAVDAVWGDYYRDAETATFPATEEYDRDTQTRLGTALLSQLGIEGASSTLPAYHDALEGWFSRPGVMRPYPEVVDVLTTLQERGYRLGIVSNWSWNLRQRVAQVDLEGYFELIWASAYAGCNKPNPGIFHQALARMDLSPEHTLYVGDSYRHDVVGARYAGLDAALLDRDGTVDNADCPVIPDLRGVLTLLGK